MGKTVLLDSIRNFLEARVYEEAVIPTQAINFSPELLKACESNVCGKYNMCWTCPPAIGTMEKLQEKILSFSHAYVFTTKAGLEDSFDYEGMMKAKDCHDRITREAHDRFGKTNPVFGAGGCTICETCAYPQTCRFPEKIFPAIEGAGINVTDLSRAGKVRYNNGKNSVTYFSMILFNM